MSYLSSTSKIVGGIIWLAGLISPAAAHNVKIDANVGATFHIEPSHNPRAGEPARAWFALTRTGGKVIPLEQCNCQLAVYQQPSAPGDSPLLQPPLKMISAEEYQGIPGADLVFPQAGAYELELSGTPKSGANFQPFQLKYTVNVSAGKTSPTASPSSKNSEVEAQPNQETASFDDTAPSPQSSAVPWLIPVMFLGAIIGIGGFWFAGVKTNSKNKP